MADIISSDVIVNKLDDIAAANCQNFGLVARDAASIREEGKDTRAAIFNRIGDAESRFTDGLRSNDKSISGTKDFLSTEHTLLGNQLSGLGIASGKNFSDTQRDVQDAKFQLHDNIVRQGTDIAKGFGLAEKSISESSMAGALTTEKVGAGLSRDLSGTAFALERKLDDMAAAQAACCCETQKEIYRGTDRVERMVDRTEHLLGRDMALGFAAVAKAQAECCCETKMLIQHTEAELKAQAVSNFNALGMQAVQNQATNQASFAALSREIEKGFCGLNTKDLERDLAAKQNALLMAQGEISNLKQTNALIDALSRKEHRG